MRFYLIFVVTISILTSSETYEKINISEKKKDLSNEIYQKLSREHYVRNFNDKDFNKKYFEAIFDRLDEEKNYSYCTIGYFCMCSIFFRRPLLWLDR